VGLTELDNDIASGSLDERLNPAVVLVAQRIAGMGGGIASTYRCIDNFREEPYSVLVATSYAI